MFHSIEAFVLLSLIAVFIAFQTLEKSLKSGGKTTPMDCFLACLGGLGAYQFHHFRGDDLLTTCLWFGFVGLLASPFLGFILFSEGVFLRLIRIIFAVLVWIGSFLWFGGEIEGPPHLVLLLSCFPVAVVMFPYGSLWKYSARRQAKRRMCRQQSEAQARANQEKEQHQQAKQKELELQEKLIRELGR